MLSSYRSLQYSICDSIKKSAQIKTCIGFQITSKLGAKMINRHSQQIRQCHSHFFSSTRSEINIHRKHSYTTVRYKSTNKKPESTASPSKGSIENSNVVPQLSLWQKWIAPRPMPPRKTMKWYMEMALLCTVFSITGTSTMLIVRPAVTDILGLKGSFKDGPWSYRISSLVIMTPIYSVMLVCVGTIFGRHAYFRHFSVKMLSRFGIPPELMDKSFHETSKTFRKW